MWTQILVTHLGFWDNFVDRDVGFCCFWPCRKAPERKPFCERLPPEAPQPQRSVSPSSPSEDNIYDDVALAPNTSTGMPPGTSKDETYDDVAVPPKPPTGRRLPDLPTDFPGTDNPVYDDVAVPPTDSTGYPLKKKRSSLNLKQEPEEEAIYEELDIEKKKGRRKY
ncbi:unnamed protein product [Ixodes pacificus]